MTMARVSDEGRRVLEFGTAAPVGALVDADGALFGGRYPGYPITISLWVRPKTGNSTNRMPLCAVSSGSWDDGITLKWQLDGAASYLHAAFKVYTDTVKATFVTADFPRWYNVQIAHDGTNASIWLGGLLEETAAQTPQAGGANGPLSIGAGQSTSARPLISYQFDGRIDDVRIFDRMLRPDEIARLALGRGIDIRGQHTARAPATAAGTEAALTLAIDAAMTSAAQGDYAPALTFGVEATVTPAATADMIAGLSLAANLTQTAITVQSVEASIALAVSSGVSLSVLMAAQSALSLAVDVDAAYAGGLDISAALTFAATVAQASSNDITIEAALTLAASAAVAQVAQADMGAALALATDLGLTPTVVADLNSVIGFDVAAGLTPIATMVTDAGLTFSAEAGLSLVGFSGLVVISVDGRRVVSVMPGSRSIVIEAGDRVVVVVAGDRTVII